MYVAHVIAHKKSAAGITDFGDVLTARMPGQGR